jgi:hypothetical protein
MRCRWIRRRRGGCRFRPPLGPGGVCGCMFSTIAWREFGYVYVYYNETGCGIYYALNLQRGKWFKSSYST